MDVHPGHILFTIALDQAEKLPAVPFVKPGMICDQIDRRDTFGLKVIDCHIEQMPRDTYAAMIFFRIYSAHIRAQVFSVMEVIFNNSQAADDTISVQA